MLPDLHVHTARCGHAGGSIGDYLEQARRLGLSYLGFADHLPLYWLPLEERHRELAMSEEELPGYVEEVLRLKRTNPDLAIGLGIEADYVPGFEERLRTLLSQHPFDYVLGSVHYIDGWGFDNPACLDGYARWEIDELYGRYFALVQQAIRSGLFDILAHPDLIKKFGYRPRADMRGLYEEVARAMAEASVCVEVNTAGLRVPAKEIYPSLEFLKACRRYGVLAAVGSDAHQPHLVAWEWRLAREWLLAAGYHQVVVFEARKPKVIKIL